MGAGGAGLVIALRRPVGPTVGSESTKPHSGAKIITETENIMANLKSASFSQLSALATP